MFLASSKKYKVPRNIMLEIRVWLLIALFNVKKSNKVKITFNMVLVFLIQQSYLLGYGIVM